ncbi:hypothetical protein L1887_49423 [Cichorium endivia]|nr:hypothetical protein L1887_49423 [Cichorium endivia]
MIGRADIEGSKSNVAMNAWLPQASYPCDVPPQPNSPPDNVFRPDRPAEAGLGSKKRGIAPLPIHGIIGFPLSVPVLSWLFDARGRPPKEPFPVRPPAGTRRPARRRGSSLEQSADSRRVRDWDPRAQPSEPILFPRSAPTAAPPRLTPKVLQRPPRPSYSSGLALAPTAGCRLARSWHRNPASGSSPHRQFCLPKMPTWSSRFRGTAQRSSRAVLPI